MELLALQLKQLQRPFAHYVAWSRERGNVRVLVLSLQVASKVSVRRNSWMLCFSVCLVLEEFNPSRCGVFFSINSRVLFSIRFDFDRFTLYVLSTIFNFFGVFTQFKPLLRGICVRLDVYVSLR